MTEQERQERVAKGYLWLDTDEFIAHQGKIKDLMYEFNMSRPSETAKRAELMKQIFGSVGKNVWINQPLSLTVGSSVTIGDGTYINAGLTLIDDCTITIGKYAVIGAGSVVTKDIPDYTVAVGNPCRPIRKINEHDKEYYWCDRRFDEPGNGIEPST